MSEQEILGETESSCGELSESSRWETISEMEIQVRVQRCTVNGVNQR
jgi:hypothetical protein